ncbi:hypothetical protein JTB14_009977 [Gonioctena quinquepunctata]|nr:hypothetical protein JTB14_009977 [Gonioctena quinquepunctata]
MSDGRKRLSGAEYRKKAKIKKDEQEHALQKTRKIEAFFKSENSNDGLRIAQENSGTSSNMENQYEQVKPAHPPDSDTEKPEGLLPLVSTSGSNLKSDSEEVAIVVTFTEIQSTTKLNTDPALWKMNDLTRDIIARDGFEQNKSCDVTKSGRMYSDHRRYLPKNIFYRKMKNNEVKERNWFVYSESKGSVFCGPVWPLDLLRTGHSLTSKDSMIGRMQKFE